MLKIRLQFGNKEHIKYAAYKAVEKLKAWKYHECDCEHCNIHIDECPYCGHEDYEDVAGPVDLLKCLRCKKLSLRSELDHWRIAAFINKIESNNLTKSNE